MGKSTLPISSFPLFLVFPRMINALITSKTRVKLLLKFFLNPNNSAYLRGLETEFGESSNSIRLELNRLEQANMLNSEVNGNKKLFKVNQNHPLYSEINSIVKKFIGLDVIVESIANRLGNLKAVYLTGELAKGIDSDILDIIFVGEVDKSYLVTLVEKAEKIVKKKIRYLIFSEKEFLTYKDLKSPLLLWQSNSKLK